MSGTPKKLVVETPGAKAAATPNRRAISVEPPSSRRSIARTPLDRSLHDSGALSSSRQALSASARRTKAPPTPHARAAIRTLDLRRAAVLTPGKKRRSLERRDSPFDAIRALSRVLAPDSQSVDSSPRDDTATQEPEARGDDDDDDLPIDRPRFSMNLEADEDSELQAPTSHGLEEDNYTSHSVEMPRRAVSEQPLGDLARRSMRFSDFAGPDADQSELGAALGFFPRGVVENLAAGATDDDQTLERIDVEAARRETLGRFSDFGLRVPLDLDQSTFIMDAQAQSSPLPPVDELPEAPATDEPSAIAEEPEDGLILEDEPDDEPENELEDVPEDDEDDDEEPQSSTAITDADMSRTAIVTQAKDLKSALRRIRGKKLSKFGIEYPSLPQPVVKRLAGTFARMSGVKTKISADTLTAISQASDWFFEQLGDDLQAYSRHAGRKTIDESDMMTLMQRQRQTSSSSTPFALAQRYLPRELLQELRMPVPQIPKKRRRANREEEDQSIA